MSDYKIMLSDEYRNIIKDQPEFMNEMVEARAQPGLFIVCPDCFGKPVDHKCWNCNGKRKLFVIPDDCVTVKESLAKCLAWRADELQMRHLAKVLFDEKPQVS